MQTDTLDSLLRKLRKTIRKGTAVVAAGVSLLNSPEIYALISQDNSEVSFVSRVEAQEIDPEMTDLGEALNRMSSNIHIVDVNVSGRNQKLTGEITPNPVERGYVRATFGVVVPDSYAGRELRLDPIPGFAQYAETSPLPNLKRFRIEGLTAIPSDFTRPGQTSNDSFTIRARLVGLTPTVSDETTVFFPVSNNQVDFRLDQQTYVRNEGDELHRVDFSTTPRISKPELDGMVDKREVRVEVRNEQGNPFGLRYEDGRSFGNNVAFCGTWYELPSGRKIRVPGEGWNFVLLKTNSELERLLNENNGDANSPAFIRNIYAQLAPGRAYARVTDREGNDIESLFIVNSKPAESEESSTPALPPADTRVSATDGDRIGDGTFTPSGEFDVTVCPRDDRVYVSEAFVEDYGRAEVYLRNRTSRTRTKLGNVTPDSPLVLPGDHTFVPEYLRKIGMETAVASPEFREFIRSGAVGDLSDSSHANYLVELWKQNVLGYVAQGNDQALAEALQRGDEILSGVINRWKELNEEKRNSRLGDPFNRPRRSDESNRNERLRREERLYMGLMMNMVEAQGHLYTMETFDGQRDANFWDNKDIVVISGNKEVVLDYGAIEKYALRTEAQNAMDAAYKLGGIPSPIAMIIESIEQGRRTEGLEQFLHDRGYEARSSRHTAYTPNQTSTFNGGRVSPVSEYAIWRGSLTDEQHTIYGRNTACVTLSPYSKVVADDKFWKFLTAALLGIGSGGASGVIGAGGTAAGVSSGVSGGIQIFIPIVP